MVKAWLKRTCVSRPGRALLSPLMTRSGFRIINFHRVLPDDVPPDDYRLLLGDPRAGEFEHLIARLKAEFDILPLTELVRRMPDWRRGFALGITFDDGYLDVARIAAPILHRLEVPYTVFLTTGFIDQQMPWFSRMFAFAHAPDLDEATLRLPKDFEWSGDTPSQLRKQLATYLTRFHPTVIHRMLDDIERQNPWYTPPPDVRRTEAFMTWHDVQTLQQSPYAAWGAHTQTHVNVSILDDTQADAELLQPRRRIAAETGRPCPFVAFPGGRFDNRILPLLKKAGYEAGFLMAEGLNTSASPAFSIRREYVSTDVKDALFQLYGFTELAKGCRRWLNL